MLLNNWITNDTISKIPSTLYGNWFINWHQMGEWQIRIKPKMTISRPMTRHKTRRNALVVLLETIPPLFHIALVSGLAYYVWHFHPNSPTWVMGSGYCVLQILLNWIQFLRYKVCFNVKWNYFWYFDQITFKDNLINRTSDIIPVKYQIVVNGNK